VDARILGTKLAERLLVRPGGATMAEIIVATGGPQYNVLKRLEGRGYRLRKVKEGRETRYFAEPPSSEVYHATMTSKGQVTIPQAVREKLGLRSGQDLRFTVDKDARVVMTLAYRRLSELPGILPKPKKTLSIEEMDEAIRGAAVGRFLRAVGRKKR